MKTMRMNKASSGGFSLIALAIGIAVAGLLLTAYLRLWQVEVEKRKMEVTRAHMRIIHTALTRYAAQHATLPCPENPAPRAKRDEDRDRKNCAPPTLKQGASDNGVWTGVAPLQALHLNEENALDGWGNKFTYAVTRTLTHERSLQGARPRYGILRVVNAQGQNVLTIDGSARYVLISHGPSGAGAWSAQGVRRLCPDGTLDSQNCDGDNFFVKAGFSLAPGASFYDDVLLGDDFKDRSTLEQLAWCNTRQAYYAPADRTADKDGCVQRQGVWTGACTLSTASQTLGLRTPPVPSIVMPPAGKSVAGSAQKLVEGGAIPPGNNLPGECQCGADYIKFNPGDWDDRRTSPAFAPTGYFDSRVPGSCLVPSGKDLAALTPASWCLKTFWMRTALFSCTPK